MSAEQLEREATSGQHNYSSLFPPAKPAMVPDRLRAFFYLGYSTNIIRAIENVSSARDTPPLQRAGRGRAKVHTRAEPPPGVPQNMLFNSSGCLCLAGCLHGRFARLTACNGVRPTCIARST